MKQISMTTEEHVTKLEKTLMAGRGRWIADFNESSRNYEINGIVFDALIEGNTRMKGFLLSRLYSFLANPNYSVGCFVLSTKSGRKLDPSSLTRVLAAVKSYMKSKEIKWSWLFIFSAEKVQSLSRMIQRIDDKDIGAVLVDVNSREIFCSSSYLGKQAKRFVKI